MRELFPFAVLVPCHILLRNLELTAPLSCLLCILKFCNFSFFRYNVFNANYLKRFLFSVKVYISVKVGTILLYQSWKSSAKRFWRLSLCLWNIKTDFLWLKNREYISRLDFLNLHISTSPNGSADIFEDLESLDVIYIPCFGAKENQYLIYKYKIYQKSW